MGKFVLGFATAIIVALLAAFCYLRFGFVDPRADIEVGMLESMVAMPSLDAAVDRRAPDTQNPIQSTDQNLIAGMKIYQTNCASCHGDVRRSHGTLADGLYPRAPQFVEDKPDMPESQNFYVILHGIRLSGMPAWKQALTEQEVWQVTSFLSHMDKLPPQVSSAWKNIAGDPQGGSAAPDASPTQLGDKKSTKMPMH